jgi:hypothetical protein
MSYCKHQWEDRTSVLREVFSLDSERRTHVFFICVRCMKINESDTDDRATGRAPRRITAA